MSEGLRGLRVGVTRSRAQASELARLLAAAGAEPVELHCLEFVDPDSFEALDASLARLPGGYDGVLFTSTNAVHRTLARGPSERFDGTLVAAMGGATAGALEEHGVTVDLVPDRSMSEGLVEALEARLGDRLRGSRWLLPRAETAREVLPESLRERGVSVDVVTAYRTISPRDPEPLLTALRGGLSAITFASGSSVRYLRAAVGDPFDELLASVAVATIGPITSAAAREQGLRVDVEAPRASMTSMVEALAGWMEANR